MSSTPRPWFVLIALCAVVAATRIPMASGQLFTFDDVNLAYSIGHFDVRISQPQPPGYPLFVMEMRVLWWLRFRRVERILFVLALAGSFAATVLLARFGNRIMGGESGYYAACLLVLNPVFWHAGVTSALRVQLAVVSLAVAAACWRAWRGEARWVLWSAVALGLGAGIRPDLGPLLLPLWAASALRAPVSWRDRGIALGAMTAAVLLWLVPAMAASGGPYQFVKASAGYLTDQASVGSGLFGASGGQWLTSLSRTLVWVFCGAIAWSLPAVLAWRRGEGWGAGRDRLAFLGWWLVPQIAFAIFVHIQDPGHALGMVPVVALFGGYLINRALDTVDARVSRWHAVILVAGALAIAWIVDRHDVEYAVTWVPVACLAIGLLLKFAQVRNAGYPPRSHVLAFLLVPVAMLNPMMFNHHGWYYRPASASGWRAVAEQMQSDFNTSLSLTSREHIETTLGIDDHSIRELRRLAAERPGATAMVWEHGLTAWRKAAYYLPAIPIVVLEHAEIRAGSPPVIVVWNGPRIARRVQGPTPLLVSLQPGSRVVWFLNPRTEFYEMARQAFPLTASGPVYYTDLPNESGSRIVGEYELAW